MKKRRVARLCIVVLALTILGYASIWFVRQLAIVIKLPSEAYASDWTATFIIEHIRTTGDWPSGWDDLRDEFDRLAWPTHYAWTFEELQKLIEVKWDCDIEQIRNSAVPIETVRLTSGRQASFAGDPNQLIFEYIKTGNDPNQVHTKVGVPHSGGASLVKPSI